MYTLYNSEAKHLHYFHNLNEALTIINCLLTNNIPFIITIYYENGEYSFDDYKVYNNKDIKELLTTK